MKLKGNNKREYYDLFREKWENPRNLLEKKGHFTHKGTDYTLPHIQHTLDIPGISFLYDMDE